MVVSFKTALTDFVDPCTELNLISVAIISVHLVCLCTFEPGWLEHFKACLAGFCPFDEACKLIFERKSVSSEMWWLRREAGGLTVIRLTDGNTPKVVQSIGSATW